MSYLFMKLKEALVVKREILFKDKYFQGFLPAHEHNFISTILKSYGYHPRGNLLENNELLQQIIPYVWIVNSREKKVFAYRRAGNENYSEVRLRNKWSCGLGGHIERQDQENPAFSGCSGSPQGPRHNGNPIESAMMRELMEEVKMEAYPKPRVIGYLKDDTGDVERVHFGVVAIAETLGTVEKGDDEMAEGKFMTLGEIEALFANPENQIEAWTKLSWPYVRQHLSSLV